MSKLNASLPPVYGGASMSKIPPFQGHSQAVPPIEMEQPMQRPSRLQQLQSNYQKQILREKEEKLIQMYEENQRRALLKVNSKGSVRDFFKERRQLEQNGNLKYSPSINQHFQMRKQSYQNNNEDWTPVGSRQNSSSSKKSMGRDKSNPLAPIDRKLSHESNIPSQVPRKPQRHGRPKTKDSIRQERPRSDVDTPLSTLSKRTTPKYNRVEDSPIQDTPPPNFSNFKSLQKKVSRSGKPPAGPGHHPKATKLTDFQKWQMEQDQAREERLKANKPESNGYEYEPSDNEEEENQAISPSEIQRKQQELMEKIANQQAELERMRIEREREEFEEKKEMERRRKREEERRRRLKEEEEIRQREREEQEERDKRLREEEELERKIAALQAKEAAEQTRRYNDEDDHNQTTRTYNRHSPTPPLNPKPVRVQRRSVKHTAPQQRTPSPALPSQDLSLYLNAAQDDEAYSQGSVKMVPCSNCGRKFAEDRIQKHRNACGNLTKKRKVMDPSKMRVEGTDMEKYTNSRYRSKTPPKRKQDWRAKREEFIRALRYAKKVSQVEKGGGNIRDITPPPPSENPDYKQCPWCSRKFNPTTAERHIPRCKDIKSRPAPPKGRR